MVNKDQQKDSDGIRKCPICKLNERPTKLLITPNSSKEGMGRLKKLLRALLIVCELNNLGFLTRESAFDWDRLNEYTLLTAIFCKGIEFFTGSIFMNKILDLKNQLKNKIHCKVKNFTMKNMLIHRIVKGTLI